MNFHLFADEVERRKVAPLAWSGLARFLKACCCSAFPKSITPVNAVVSFCLIRVLYELTSGMRARMRPEILSKKEFTFVLGRNSAG